MKIPFGPPGARLATTMALFLVPIKTYASWDTGSVAMLGSLADTTLDFIASLVTFFGVRWAAMPADEEHRYGHGKAEALAALTQVILIAVSALGIAWRAFDRLRSGEPLQDDIRKAGQVVATFAQWRHAKFDDVDAVIQVVAEAAFAHQR